MPPEPYMIAYHGSIYRFDKPEEFKHLKRIDFGPGFYMATSEADARIFGPIVYEAAIELHNPLIIGEATPPDAILKFRRALKVDDEHMAVATADGSHPMVALMELAKTLMELGDFNAYGLLKFFQKLGYDSIYVDNDVVRPIWASWASAWGFSKGRTIQGDFIALFTPQQLRTWKRL